MAGRPRKTTTVNSDTEAVVNENKEKASDSSNPVELEKLNIQSETFAEGLSELKELVKYIKIFGVPETNFKIDLTIARGLDYYTGTVYETFLDEYRFLGSVCSGGRYDNLAEYYTEKKFKKRISLYNLYIGIKIS